MSSFSFKCTLLRASLAQSHLARSLARRRPWPTKKSYPGSTDQNSTFSKSTFLHSNYDFCGAKAHTEKSILGTSSVPGSSSFPSAQWIGASSASSSSQSSKPCPANLDVIAVKRPSRLIGQAVAAAVGATATSGTSVATHTAASSAAQASTSQITPVSPDNETIQTYAPAVAGSFAAQAAARLIAETKSVIDSFIRTYKPSRDDSAEKAVAVLKERLPAGITTTQASLLLMRGFKDFVRKEQGESFVQFVRNLYQMTLRSERQPDLARRILPSFISCHSIPQALFAAELAQDDRISSSRMRWRLRRMMDGLEQLVVTLDQRGVRSKESFAQRRQVIETWRQALESLRWRGTLADSPRADAEPSSRPLVCDVVLARFLLMCANWGPASSSIRFARAIGGDTRCLLVDANVDQPKKFNGKRLVTSASRKAGQSLTVAEEVICRLLRKNLSQQAATFFELLPEGGRSLRSYVSLLEHFGEADLSWTADTRTYATLKPRPPSIAYHRQLWLAAVEKVKTMEAVDRGTAMRHLYGARIVSHVRFKSARRVEHDLFELRSLESILPVAFSQSELSAVNKQCDEKFKKKGTPFYTLLPHPAQVAVVQTYAMSGFDSEACRHAEEIVEEWRDIYGEIPRRLGSAIFNTLLLSAVSAGNDAGRKIPLGGSRRAKRTEKLQCGSFSLDASAEEALTQLMTRHDELIAVLRLHPDIVTRNILLLHLLRWLGPFVCGMKDDFENFLHQCGVLLNIKADQRCDRQASEDDILSSRRGRRQVAIQFLRYGRTLLRGIVKDLLKRGEREKARKILGLLRESKDCAERELKEHPRWPRIAAA